MHVEIKGVLISHTDLMETILGTVDGEPVGAITNLPAVKRAIIMELTNGNKNNFSGGFASEEIAAVAFKVASELLIKSHQEKHAAYCLLEDNHFYANMNKTDKIMLNAVREPEQAIKKYGQGKRPFKINLS